MRAVITRLILVLLFIVMLFSLASCGERADSVPLQDGASENAVKFGYFTFPATDWGMTEDEVFKGLKQEKDSFTLDERIHTLSGDLKSIRRTYQKKMSFLGDDIELFLDFSNSAPSTIPRLNSVQWIYTDRVTREKFDGICTKLEDMVLKQNIPIEEIKITEKNENVNFEAEAVIQSQAIFKELSDEIRAEYAELIKYQAVAFAENGVNSDGKIKIADDPLRQMIEPLCELTIRLITDENNEGLICRASMLGNRNNYLNLLYLKNDINE